MTLTERVKETGSGGEGRLHPVRSSSLDIADNRHNKSSFSVGVHDVTAM